MFYDVVIAGGGAAGCAAAFNLGINGKKVLLVEKNNYLGGLMTGGLVTPFMKSSENQINTEFTKIFLSEMKKNGASITYLDGNDGWFNPEYAKIVLDKLMSISNVEVRFDTVITAALLDNSVISEITISSKMLSEHIKSRYFIDATGNCDFSKILNCNFLNKNDEIQATNLRFIMSNIDIDKFAEWILDIDTDRNVTTVCKIGNETHLSTACTWDTKKNWALTPLFELGVKEGILKNEDRNYFQVFTIPKMPNSIAFNCPRVCSKNVIDPLNNRSYSLALRLGRESILRLSEFCKSYFKGFENAYISSIADMLGVRVSRRLKGRYIFTIEDIKSGKKFDNPVLISNYPVDVHSTKNNKSILEKVNIEYQMPIEAMISADYDNLFVAGRCVSADFYAQSAIRIIPSCFSMGEGLAKYILEL